MAASVDDILQAIAPESCGMAAGRRAIIIDLAAAQVGPVFGENRNTAIAYLAAHMMVMGQRGGAAGAVTALKEGDLAVSYASGQSNSGDGLDATGYGQEFIRLRKACVFSPRTRMQS